MLENELAKQSLVKAWRALWTTLPVLLGAMLLIALLTSFISESTYTSVVFLGNPFLDAVIAAALGSILAGNPATSYILGGELLESGVSLLAVTAFLVSWVTVGIIQFPAESILLGKRFALFRNISAFIFSILVAFVTVSLVGAW